MIFLESFYRYVNARYGVMARLKAAFDGIQIGNAVVYEDAGHLNIVNPTVGKNIVIDGKDSVILRRNGSSKFYIRGAGSLVAAVKMMMYSGSAVEFKNADNTKYGYIKNAGANGVEGPIDCYNSDTVPVNVLSWITDGINSMNHYPKITNTYDQGSDTLRWQRDYINARHVSIKTLGDENYIVLGGDFAIKITGILGPHTILLPANPDNGRWIKIRAGILGGNNLIIQPAGGHTIDGAPVIMTNTDNETFDLIYDGSVGVMEWKRC